MTLEELAREGCAIETYMSPPCPVSVIEITGNHLFWITQFPEDQHHTHVMDFDRVEHVSDVGITFYEGGGTGTSFRQTTHTIGNILHAS